MVFTHINLEKNSKQRISPYEKIILHVGECDISFGVDVDTLWSNMHKLLLDLRPNFTVVVSRLLPRKGCDVNSCVKNTMSDLLIIMTDL